MRRPRRRGRSAYRIPAQRLESASRSSAPGRPASPPRDFSTAKASSRSIFDRRPQLGGQWSRRPRFSCVWPSMRTNTSRILTAFSDLRYAPGTPVYPDEPGCAASTLGRYAAMLGLTSASARDVGRRSGHAATTDAGRFAVTRPRRAAPIRGVRSRGRGRHRPLSPAAPPGIARACDVQRVRRGDPRAGIQGRARATAGCGCSSRAARSARSRSRATSPWLGAERVVTTQRRQRYVLQKLLAGVPDGPPRFLAGRRDGRRASAARGCRPRHSSSSSSAPFGNPAQFGAPSAGRGHVRGRNHALPALPAARRRRAHLDQALDRAHRRQPGDVRRRQRRGVRCDRVRDRLRAGSAVPGRALAGRSIRTRAPDAAQLHVPSGPAGARVRRAVPSDRADLSGASSSRRDVSRTRGAERGRCRRQSEMRAGIEAYRLRAICRSACRCTLTARIFAGEAGVEPDLTQWPALARPLLFGPLRRSPTGSTAATASPMRRAGARRVRSVRGRPLLESRCRNSARSCRRWPRRGRDLDFAAFVGQITGGVMANVQRPDEARGASVGV